MGKGARCNSISNFRNYWDFWKEIVAEIKKIREVPAKLDENYLLFYKENSNHPKGIRELKPIKPCVKSEEGSYFLEGEEYKITSLLNENWVAKFEIMPSKMVFDFNKKAIVRFEVFSNDFKVVHSHYVKVDLDSPVSLCPFQSLKTI